MYTLRTVYTREKRDLERKCRENIDIWVKVVHYVHSRPACTVYSTVFCTVIRSVQNILCWLACSVHNRPPSPKFQFLPSQLRQRADRAAGLSIKSLWYTQQTASTNVQSPQRIKWYHINQIHFNSIGLIVSLQFFAILLLGFVSFYTFTYIYH
jgi:hypothetical protein